MAWTRLVALVLFKLFLRKSSIFSGLASKSSWSSVTMGVAEEVLFLG